MALVFMIFYLKCHINFSCNGKARANVYRLVIEKWLNFSNGKFMYFLQYDEHINGE